MYRSSLELSINPSLNARLIPAHIQGQGAVETIAAAAAAAATASSHIDSSLSTSSAHEKKSGSHPTTESSTGPLLPDTAIVGHSAHSTDAMNTLDDPTSNPLKQDRS
jgi:hypothetical protein